MSDVTRLIDAAAAGDPKAAAELLPLVYDELRRLAAARMSEERPDHTLDATALVHEAYVRLVGGSNRAVWDHRRQFLSAVRSGERPDVVDRLNQVETTASLPLSWLIGRFSQLS